MQMDTQTTRLKRAIKQVTALRRARGWSQEYCAHQLGVAYSSLNRWERGESLPKSRLVIQAIDRFLAQQAGGAPEPPRRWN
ncbi:MAG: helix-turn-helix transcriptional regulator [Candidatus Omnitrophica bacterium]|nr:helix-turn-helix transcriptional regulator [Candidatus Omnitrophota bacterium]